MTALAPTITNPDFSRSSSSLNCNDLAGSGVYDYGFRDYSDLQMRFTTVDPIKDGQNWYAYVGNDPINFIDLLGLAEIVAGNIVYNSKNNSFSDFKSGSIKDNTTIDITRPAGHTRGHYKSTLDINVKSSDGSTVNIFSNPVQSWADKADPNDPTEYTAPAGTYEGRLYGETGSYSNPVGMVNEKLGVKEEHHVLIHGNEFNNPSSDRFGDSWQNTGSSEACQITQGQATRYDAFTSSLKSAGYKFGEGYKNYKDTIDININDPDYILTTRDGKEINFRNDPDAIKNK